MQEGFAPTDNSKSGSDKAADRHAEMLKVFKQIDADSSGSIDVKELADAMRLLGVKCTANSAKKVLKVIDTDGSGTIELDEFLAFFTKVSDPEEIKAMLSSANQKFMDYKTMVECDPQFGKKFHIPLTKTANAIYEGHAETVECARWLEGDQFVTASLDGDLKWYTLDRLQPQTMKKATRTVTVAGGKGIYCFEIAADLKTAIVGTGLKTDNLFLWDLTKGADGEKVEPVTRFKGMTVPCYACTISPNGTWVVSGYKNGEMLVHKTGVPGEAGEEPTYRDRKHEKVMTCASFCPDNVHFCTVSNDGNCHVFDVADGKRCVHMKTIEDVAATGCVFKCIFRTPTEILTCGDDYCAKRWDLNHLVEGPITNFFGHTSNVTGLAISPPSEHHPPGQLCITGAADGCARLWVIDEMENLKTGLQTIKKETNVLKSKIKIEEAKEWEDQDHPQLQAWIAKLKKNQEDQIFLEDAQAERMSMGCVQARMAFEGHKLALTGSAWKWLDEDSVALLTTSQDQSCRCYMFTCPTAGITAADFVKLDKDAEPGAARRQSKRMQSKQ